MWPSVWNWKMICIDYSSQHTLRMKNGWFLLDQYAAGCIQTAENMDTKQNVGRVNVKSNFIISVRDIDLCERNTKESKCAENVWILWT